jgi:hypothetical protein
MVVKYRRRMKGRWLTMGRVQPKNTKQAPRVRPGLGVAWAPWRASGSLGIYPVNRQAPPGENFEPAASPLDSSPPHVGQVRKGKKLSFTRDAYLNAPHLGR